MVRLPLSLCLVCISLLAAAQADRRSVRQGNREYRQGHYPNAEIAYRTAKEINPESFKAQFNLGNALYKQEMLSEAAEVFQGIAPLAPSPIHRAKVYHNLGNALLKQQQVAESVEAYRNALRQNPDDLETKYNLSQALRLLREQPQCDQGQGQGNGGEQEGDQNRQDRPQGNSPQNPRPEGNQPDEQQQQQQQQQQPQQQQITPEEARRMLEALQRNEQQVKERMEQQRAQRLRREAEKFW